MKRGLLVLGACTLVTAVPATAGENPFAKDQTVLRLSGLDLSTAEGQQRLAIRMDQAAREVCGDRLATVHLAADAKASECRTAVLADIRAQIEARMARSEAAAGVQLASLR